MCGRDNAGLLEERVVCGRIEDRTLRVAKSRFDATGRERRQDKQ
jgi:hypothetical protein